MRAFFTQYPRQFAGINTRNADEIVMLEILIQILLAAPVARTNRKIPNDEAVGIYSAGLFIFHVDAGITDMWIG